MITNENGTFTLQLPNAALGSTYYIKVDPFDPFGTHNVGNYALTANFSGSAPVTFDALDGGTLVDAARQHVESLNVNQGRVYVFSLSADANGSATAAAVRMTLVDGTGHALFSQVAYAGRELSTGTVYLGAGNYDIVYTAGTKLGAALPDLTFTLGKRVISDPLDAIPLDPSSVDIAINKNPNPVIVILDPISDPYS